MTGIKINIRQTVSRFWKLDIDANKTLKSSLKKLFHLLPPGDGWKLASLFDLMILLEVIEIGILQVSVSMMYAPLNILDI